MPFLLINQHLRKEAKEFLKLAILLASAEVSQAATSFVDTIMMGWLGREYLASGGLAAITLSMLLTIATGVISGISPLVASAYGAKDCHKIEQIARQGLWLAVILAVPIIILITHVDIIMYSFGQQTNTIALATSYLNVMIWGIFPTIGFAVLRDVVAGLSKARILMFIGICSTLLNIVGNYILGFGKFGFPKMELAGLAIASIISQWGMFLILVLYLITNKQLKQYHIFYNFDFKLPTIWSIIKIGLPIALNNASEIGLFTVIGYLMGTLGIDVLAAHQIVSGIDFFVFTIFVGISYATTIRVAQWNGGGNSKAVHTVWSIAAFIGTGFMFIIASILLSYSQELIGLYLDTNNPENNQVIELTIKMLNVAIVVQIVDSLQKITRGALQGLEDTRTPMLISLFSFWGVGLLVGYILGFFLASGGVGLWLGHLVGTITSTICLIFRFRRQ